jgi:ABC-type Zn uptake system ZnuABC Zn-binding protein ZnuA
VDFKGEHHLRAFHFSGRLLCGLLLSGLLISCGGCMAQESGDTAQLQVVASTYPIYALACSVSAGVDDVSVTRLSTGQVSCLHDYTLTVSDMRHLEQADLLLLNGAGLEEFLEDVLNELSSATVDCSLWTDLLESDEDAHHSHGSDLDDGEHDPHYWMDPDSVIQMTYAIAQGLCETDPDHARDYEANAQMVTEAIEESDWQWSAQLSGLSCPYLITFHDGFRYFAEAFDLELLFSMEEEEGATASARDILTASELVKEYHLPCVFMEENGPGAAAGAVSGETGADIATLSMLMDGVDLSSLEDTSSAIAILDEMYLSPMAQNVETLKEVLK